MTVLMYARRKGWDVEDISITLTHDRVHADDADGHAGQVDVIERHISIRGDLTDEQRQRLLEIAGRCPIHRTITGSPRVVDTLISGD
jgi:putative redox protein